MSLPDSSRIRALSLNWTFTPRLRFRARRIIRFSLTTLACLLAAIYNLKDNLVSILSRVAEG